MTDQTSSGRHPGKVTAAKSDSRTSKDTLPGMPDLSAQELGAALASARYLIEHGVPVFRAAPATREDGSWDPRGGNGAGYRLPKGWQRTTPDLTVLDEYQRDPSYALCAVMGVKVDGLDVDAQHDGPAHLDAHYLIHPQPESYGRATTPSGGTHDLIAPLGVGSFSNQPCPGVDVRGGRPDGSGRGFLFIAPTVKVSKTTGKLDRYRWVEPPQFDALAPDEGSRAMAQVIGSRHRLDAKPATVSAEDRDPASVREQVAEVIQSITDDLAAVAPLAESQTDERGNGWEKTTADAAYQLHRIAITPHSGYDEASAYALFKQIVPDVMWTTERYDGDLKWREQREPARTKGGPLSGVSKRQRALEGFDELDDDEATPAAASPSQSSWAPVDLDAVLADDYEPRLTTLLAREDGVCLLYGGLTHTIQGESGSGKSLLVQWEASRVIKSGGRVLYCDFESNAGEVVRGRMMEAFGCTAEQIRAGLVYVRPDEAPKGAAFDALLGQPFELAVIDGVTEALNTSGIAAESITNSNDAVTKWNRLLPRRIADETGAAVVLIDHVTKASGNRAWALGAQAKRAAATGATFTVETKERFSRGHDGFMELFVNKDREGRIPLGKTKAEGSCVGTVYVTSELDGSVTIRIAPPVDLPVETEADREQALREAVLDYLKEQGQAVSMNRVKKGVEGTDAAVGAAVEVLEQAGKVQVVRQGPGRASLVSLVA